MNLPVKNCVQNCKRPCIVRRSLVSPFSSLSAALDSLHLEIKTILKEHPDLFLHMHCHKIFIILCFVIIFYPNFIYSRFIDKVCIIQDDHICFEKSLLSFWQVRCCVHRTRHSCQKYDKDFFKYCGLLRKPKLYSSVMRVGSVIFGDPIFQKGLQN